MYRSLDAHNFKDMCMDWWRIAILKLPAGQTSVFRYFLMSVEDMMRVNFNAC